MSHILARHYNEFVDNGIVKSRGELFDFLMHGIRSGKVISSRPSTRGEGTTYVLEADWDYRSHRFQITINTKGEVVQSNPVRRAKSP